MRFLSLLLLFFLTSCLEPSDLDKLQDYADTKLKSNVLEFSQYELRKWWDEYYKNQTLLVVANGKAYEAVLTSIPRPEKIESISSSKLLDQLIVLYDMNLSLKDLGRQAEFTRANWKLGCQDKSVINAIQLRERIEANYISGLRFPNIAQTYMVGGGTGGEGLNMFIESIATNLGSLFNAEKARAMKKKISKIKKSFRDNIPSDAELFAISVATCEKSSLDNQPYLDAVIPLIDSMKSSVSEEWKYYQGQKAVIGKLLLDRNLEEIRKRDTSIDEKLGINAANNLRANLSVMRAYLSQLFERYQKSKSVEAKEELQDFILSFTKQLQMVRTFTFPDAVKLADDNQLYVDNFKRRIL